MWTIACVLLIFNHIDSSSPLPPRFSAFVLLFCWRTTPNNCLSKHQCRMIQHPTSRRIVLVTANNLQPPAGALASSSCTSGTFFDRRTRLNSLNTKNSAGMQETGRCVMIPTSVSLLSKKVMESLEVHIPDDSAGSY